MPHTYEKDGAATTKTRGLKPKKVRGIEKNISLFVFLYILCIIYCIRIVTILEGKKG